MGPSTVNHCLKVLWPAEVTLDASSYAYGQRLQLCTDWGAVAGARPGSFTGAVAACRW